MSRWQPLRTWRLIWLVRQGVNETYTGILALQTDALITQILNYGFMNLSAFSPTNWTEKSVVPLPFVPTSTDYTSPLTFLFYRVNAPDLGQPLGYALADGFMIGPPLSTVPFGMDVSSVAWTRTLTSPYSVSSINAPVTVSSTAGSVTLPITLSNVATFTRTEDCKVILRRYRQKLW